MSLLYRLKALRELQLGYGWRAVVQQAQTRPNIFKHNNVPESLQALVFPQRVCQAAGTRRVNGIAPNATPKSSANGGG